MTPTTTPAFRCLIALLLLANTVNCGSRSLSEDGALNEDRALSEERALNEDGLKNDSLTCPVMWRQISWPDDKATIRSFWGSSPENLYAVGAVRESMVSFKSLMLIRNGESEWSEVSVPALGPIRTIWGDRETGRLLACSATTSCFTRTASSGWLPAQFSEQFVSLSGSNLADLHASNQGIYKRQDDGSWELLKEAFVEQIWVQGKDLYASLTATGVVLSRRRGVWHREVVIPGSYGTPAIWGDGLRHVFAALDNRVARMSDGSGRWLDLDTGLPESIRLLSIWGSSPNDVFVVGSEGTILWWNGYGWRRLPSPVSANLAVVWGLDRDHVFVGGEDGTILRLLCRP